MAGKLGPGGNWLRAAIPPHITGVRPHPGFAGDGANRTPVVGWLRPQGGKDPQVTTPNATRLGRPATTPPGTTVGPTPITGVRSGSIPGGKEGGQIPFLLSWEFFVSEFSGTRLRAARGVAGLSREALAVAVGRTAQTVAGWELGHTKPPASTVFAIARVLGIRPQSLLDDQ